MERQEAKVIADIKKSAKAGQLVSARESYLLCIMPKLSVSHSFDVYDMYILCVPQDVVKVMAKDLVRTRRYIKKMIMMKTQIQAVSLKIQVCVCVCVYAYTFTRI